MHWDEERMPGRQEIEELLAFLPIFTAEGFTPVLKDFSLEEKDGVFSPSYPVYHDEVDRFMSAVGGSKKLSENTKAELEGVRER